MIFAILMNPKTLDMVQVTDCDLTKYLDLYVTSILGGAQLGSFRLSRWRVYSRCVRVHTSGGLPLEYRGKGFGALLYLGAALVASRKGFRGVWSVASERSESADKVWERLKEKNLAVEEYEKIKGAFPGERQYTGREIDMLLAKTVKKSGLVVAFPGYRADPYQAPADLAIRAKVRNHAQAELIYRALKLGYGSDVAEAFAGREDVRKLVGSLEGLGGLPELSDRSKTILDYYGDLHE